MQELPVQPQKQPSFIREYWYVFALIFLFLLLAIAFVLRLLTPISKQIPQQENSWQELTPGYSKLKQVEEKLGSPIEVEPGEKVGTLKYQSTYPSKPHEVRVDDKQTVVFIKENIDYRDNEQIQTYLDKYGEADLVLTNFEIGDSAKAHIYLNLGLAIIAHRQGLVLEKWYFEPTSKEVFLAAWGEKLSETETYQDILDL